MADNNTNTFYLRPSLDAAAPMEAMFNFAGAQAILFMNGMGEVSVHKITRTGHSKRPLATGKFRKSNMRGQHAPDIIGSIKDSKGFTSNLVAWYHDDPDSPYYVLRYDERPARQGTAFSPDSLAG